MRGRAARTDGLHVEICGWASWSRARWLESGNLPMLGWAAAKKTARWCWLYGIPRRWLSVDELRADRRGAATHVDVNHAFGRGDHWDPGAGVPREWFLESVRDRYRRIVEDRAR